MSQRRRGPEEEKTRGLADFGPGGNLEPEVIPNQLPPRPVVGLNRGRKAALPRPGRGLREKLKERRDGTRTGGNVDMNGFAEEGPGAASTRGLATTLPWAHRSIFPDPGIH